MFRVWIFSRKESGSEGLLGVTRTNQRAQRDQGLGEDGVHFLGHQAGGWGTGLGGGGYWMSVEAGSRQFIHSGSCSFKGHIRSQAGTWPINLGERDGVQP